MAFPESWDNYFLISITRRGGSEIQFGSVVDPTSLEITEGEQQSESMPNAAGGRIWKDDPKSDGEISFDFVDLELDTASGVGLFQQYIGKAGGEGTAYDTSEPLATEISGWDAGVNRVRDQFRVVVLFTNDPAATAAAAATAVSTDSLRFAAHNCKFVNLEHNFSDGQKKATATFKFKPFRKDGTQMNYQWDSGDQTALGALGTYNTTNFPN